MDCLRHHPCEIFFSFLCEIVLFIYHLYQRQLYLIFTNHLCVWNGPLILIRILWYSNPKMFKFFSIEFIFFLDKFNMKKNRWINLQKFHHFIWHTSKIYKENSFYSNVTRTDDIWYQDIQKKKKTINKREDVIEIVI